ncbi:TPA: fimbria/pilus periplasmic chaperone [Klebsiella aerogenes]|nr:fimbria/pilus periplasmic chaperone [Klebsiella aerogenes]
MLRQLFSRAAGAASMLFLFSLSAHASIVITGTRVIYPSDAREVSVKISNKGKSPVLIQSWLDKGDTSAKPDQIKLPFTLTPPINRVEPGNGQTLRIRALPNNFPTNKETVMWLNVLEIPAKPMTAKEKENYLQVAFRSRIKFFWRPAGLAGSAGEAPKKLTWHHDANGLHVKNPTPYYVSFSTVTAGGKQADGQMVAPFSQSTYKLAASAGSKLQTDYINDYGAVVKQDYTVQ